MKFPKTISKDLFILFFLLFGLNTHLFGKFQPSPNQNTSICPFDHRLVPYGLKIRAVKVSGRGGNDKIEQKLTVKFGNKDYSRDLLYEVQKEVEDSLSNEVNQSFEKQSGIIGGASPTVIFTKPCVEIDNTAKTIDFVINIFFLRTDLAGVANNILPIPRSIKPSFYDQMPPALRAFNPQFDFNYDRKTGPEGSLNISTNLLELSNLWKGEKLSESNYHLDFKFTGKKSFSNQFYQSKTNLSFARVQPGKVVEKLDFKAGFIDKDQPLNKNNYRQKELEIGGEIKLRPRFGALNTIYLSGSYGKTNNKVFDKSGLQILANKEDKFQFRTLIDGILWNGFSRTGLWVESAKIKNSSDNYRRIAGIIAYQKEFGEGTQTFGLETVFGAGKTWGKVPIYAQFFGGNNSTNFLYDSPDSPTMSSFPGGPLLRSYGKTQTSATKNNGAIFGGNTYWHTNFNLSFPIRPWSKRLIPEEEISFSDGSNKKLNELLEDFTINTAIGGIGGDLLDSIIEDLIKKDPTLDEDEAERLAVPIAKKQAEKLVNKEIAPTIRFISRHANLFAVKPLIMLDAAKISQENPQFGRYRFGAGGGLQIVVVTARAEFGYLASLPRKTGGSKGNFVFRITFQNLF
ncbi:MAG TPA: hypothetical protein PKY82_18460 [Pyrinomonadaceae bacterium]|nr:hypothetical protein [Pyrinomonadaceae bacterium]